MSKLEKHIQQIRELQTQYATDQITWELMNRLITRLKKLRPIPTQKKKAP